MNDNNFMDKIRQGKDTSSADIQNSLLVTPESINYTSSIVTH